MQFDLSRLYSLLQAFDLTGRRIFGQTWRGNEAFARPTDNPQPLREERERLLTRIVMLEREEQEHSAIFKVDAGREAFNAASRALAPIKEEKADLKRRLEEIPDLLDWWIADYAAFERRQRVEKELRDAFDRGDLLLQVGPNDIVDWRSWCRRNDFRVYFKLSMVRIPDDVGGQRRRGPAFVEKVALDNWVNRFEASHDTLGRLAPKARLKDWLRDKVRTESPKQRSKADYRKAAKLEISGLTDRAFNSVWDQTVPDNWQRSGRPRKTDE